MYPLTKCPGRRGAANNLIVLLAGGIGVLVVLGIMLFGMTDKDHGPGGASDGEGGAAAKSLFLYCAAGTRPPADVVCQAYQEEFGVEVQVQYGGSNTLLSQIEASKVGDLYIAADASYITQGQDKGLIEEALPIAHIRPVIAVKKGNPREIASIEDLLKPDIKTALGNPDQAAVGRKTRKFLKASGHWEKLEKHVTESGTFKPTVPDAANAVKLGSVDAAVVWDTTVSMYSDSLEGVPVPELDAGRSLVQIGVLSSSKQPTEALRFARYLTARDKGLLTYKEKGYEIVEGDVWSEHPEITFFCGSVNRRAVEALVMEFQEREGATVNTVYNGCGTLTGQMKTIRDQQAGQGFPDTYMACDRYYLDTVEDWFQEDVDVSDTEIVIAVAKGNPKKIQTLQDLTRDGLKVSIGEPKQCTIGVLTEKLLKAENVFDTIQPNIATQTASSAMLVPTLTTGSVDATLAFHTDTLAESDKVDVIRIKNNAAQAIQPFSIAKTSNHKELSRRLYRKIADSKSAFEAAGFHWRLEPEPSILPTAP